MGEDSHENTGSVWAFLWIIFFFKMATVVTMLYFLRERDSNLIIGATTWYWFPLFAILFAAPVTYHFRVRKARRRRAELLRQEFMVDHPDDVPALNRAAD